MGTRPNSVLLLLVLIVSILLGTDAGVLDNRIDQCNLPDALVQEIRGYQPIVNKIVQRIVGGEFAGKTWESLAELVDTFGARLAGTDQLERTIDWVLERMGRDGLENVHTEEASVPHWVRGFESAQLVAPFKKNLAVLGLGTSVGTPRGGIIADVIAVESFKEFEGLSPVDVKGKIVVFVPKWESYGKTVVYRSKGASVAAKKGAVATLIRSVTPFSIGSPHTGGQDYEEGVRKIPSACITVEDAEMILRKYRRGETLTIHLEMEDRNLEPFMSRNTIAELVGTTYTNYSVVIVSGNGTAAAADDPSDLVDGEELGLWGGRAYKEAHKAEEKKEFNFFFESDIGTFEPRGLDFSGNKEAECIMREIVKLMGALNATEFETPTDGGPDISHWTTRGFPGASLLNKNEKYFWFHHSAGDSMAVEDPKNLDKCAALWAAAAYVVADLSVSIPKDVTD
ncbi:hypothetical protein pipiens_001810 [Culex pipiens pipiens]|uniref:Carboxypeptidase Q n=1 Tax=Culex pipiens pipiens TaxID=38569 RepID=A0ABD1DUT3_CULPP